MTVSINDGGTWKTATPYVNDGGTWKAVQEVWVNDAGTWKQAYVAYSFNPAEGSYSKSTQLQLATFNVTCTVPVTWTYTKSGSTTTSTPSGTNSTGIGFSCTKGASGSVNLQCTTSDGVTHFWDCTFGAGIA